MLSSSDTDILSPPVVLHQETVYPLASGKINKVGVSNRCTRSLYFSKQGGAMMGGGLLIKPSLEKVEFISSEVHLFSVVVVVVFSEVIF